MNMKKFSSILLGLACALPLVGCVSYTGVASTPDGHVVVAKNGLLGHWVYVCSATPTGLANCQSADAP